MTIINPDRLRYEWRLEKELERRKARKEQFSATRKSVGQQKKALNAYVDAHKSDQPQHQTLSLQQYEEQLARRDSAMDFELDHEDGYRPPCPEHLAEREELQVEEECVKEASDLLLTFCTRRRLALDVVDQLAEQLYDEAQMDEQELLARTQLLDLLERQIRELYPAARLCRFGSAANGSATKNSDEDVALMIPAERLGARGELGLLRDLCHFLREPQNADLTGLHSACALNCSVSILKMQFNLENMLDRVKEEVEDEFNKVKVEMEDEPKKIIMEAKDKLKKFKLEPGDKFNKVKLEREEVEPKKAKVETVEHKFNEVKVETEEDEFNKANMETEEDEFNKVNMETDEQILRPIKKPKLLDVDMCVNNQAGVANSRLLAFYLRQDKRVRILLALLKHWARHQQLVGGQDQKLNSYTLALLLIYYLQQGVRPALLPNLHLECRHLDFDAFNRGELELDDVQLDFDPSQQRMTVAELFIGFVLFYSQFDFSEWTLNIHRSRLLSRYNGHEFVGMERPMNLEDPCGGANPARALSDENFRAFLSALHAFNRAVWDADQKRLSPRKSKTRSRSRAKKVNVLSDKGILDAVCEQLHLDPAHCTGPQLVLEHDIYRTVYPLELNNLAR